MNLTKELIYDYMLEVGECFIDRTEHLINGVTISSFMAGCRQQIAPKLWELMNDIADNEYKSRYSIQDTLELYEELFAPNDFGVIEEFYDDFIEAVNTTVVTKQRLLDFIEESLSTEE